MNAMPAWDLEPVPELVSVIIPVRNEERFIARTLDAILGQTYPNLEVLVVDGASTDRTPAIVEEYAARDARVRLLHNPKAIVPISLNIGARAARARWMVRVDGHATVNDDYVEIAVGHLQTGEWGGVGGRVDAVGRTPAGRAVAAVMGSKFGIGNSIHHYGTEPAPADHVPFPAYPVALVREIGGWDEHLAVNQDFEFDYRLGLHGHRLLYDPALVISYECQQTLRGLYRQFRRYGKGKATVVCLHPRSLRARHLIPPALIASWLGALVLGVRRPKLALASLVPYAVGVAAASVATARKVDDRRTALRLPGAFVTVHGAWGLGFWQGLAKAAPNAARRHFGTRSTAPKASAAISSRGRVASRTISPGTVPRQSA